MSKFDDTTLKIPHMLSYIYADEFSPPPTPDPNSLPGKCFTYLCKSSTLILQLLHL